MSEEIPVNGIDATTGLYLPAPATDADLAVRIREAPLEAEKLEDLEWWTEGYGVDDPNRAPVEDVDPLDLASAGWAVVFAPDTPAEVRNALKPFLKHREDVAGRFFKPYEYIQGQSADDFLERHKAPPGPADPNFIPYYILLVGDPRTIPFRFQYELDVQYAVGRIWFETAGEYARYAESVKSAETSPPSRPRQLTLFGAANDDDQATQRCVKELIAPLAEKLSGNAQGWKVRTVLGPEATKAQLGRVLGGKETAPFLFTATHGVKFPSGDPRQLGRQGALLCQDWPGPKKWRGEIPPELYFSAEDVGEDADVHGTVVFHFACFGGGTPERDGFSLDALSAPARLAPHPFVARLPQRLLSHPRGGALAVVSHVDRAWTTSFSWVQGGQVQVFDGTLQRLLKGHPVGSAMEYFNQRHAELAVKLGGMWEDRESSREVSRSRFARVWRANNDTRNFLVFGDPAVRLTQRGSPS